jgi:hypothetical protein
MSQSIGLRTEGGDEQNSCASYLTGSLAFLKEIRYACKITVLVCVSPFKQLTDSHKTLYEGMVSDATLILYPVINDDVMLEQYQCCVIWGPESYMVIDHQKIINLVR